MTMTTDAYIDRVLDAMPRLTPRRAQIAAELRGHIAQRVASGQSLDAALGSLGDPVALAASYVSALPLVSARLGPRVLAKIADLCLPLVVAVPILAGAWIFADRAFMPFVLALTLIGSGLFFWIYTIVAEWQTGQTIGKRLFALTVVREDGTRIGGGQAVVRQLPVLFQFYWVDVLFVLFTEKRQRAFELLSKTRVVCATTAE